MVVFNCNACGEALKKNQVEKHTQRCRNCQVLSCVDCGKDFWGNDYEAHTKCITEEQKYCGKGYVPKVNKGEVKQEMWIEKVQSAIENSTSNPKLKVVLERLKDYPNIPRKKAKFENFLKNSMRVNSDPLISQVWDTLMAGAGLENGTQNGHDKKDKTVNEPVTDKQPHVQETAATDETGQKNKKTSKKKKDEDIENAEARKEERKNRKLNEKEEVALEETNEKSAKKNVDSHLLGESVDDGQKLSKRQRKEERKKKANKKEKKDKNENSCSNEGKKGKKRKLSEIEEAEATVESHEEMKNKSAEINDNVEKSRNSEPICDESNDENDEEHLEPKKKRSKKVKFNWEATILTVLKSKGEISLKKLQKKVISEFISLDAANYSEDNLRAKFLKKVNKMAKVKVSKDRVKLK